MQAGRYTYPQGGFTKRVFAEHAFLMLAPLVLWLWGEAGTLVCALALAIPTVFGWGILSLHFPSWVDVDEEGIAFGGYGRAHRFSWSRIEALRVRRFLTRDRVLVRIVPCCAMRGRYWLLDSMMGYEGLVAVIEKRAREIRGDQEPKRRRETASATGASSQTTA